MADMTPRGRSVTSGGSGELKRRRLGLNIRVLEVENERTEIEILEYEETIAKRRESIEARNSQIADLNAELAAPDVGEEEE